MKDICLKGKDYCSGCEACANACSHNAISMKADWRGFLYPTIDKDKCVDCGLCQKVCPANNDTNTSFQFREAAVYIDNDAQNYKEQAVVELSALLQDTFWHKVA